MRIVLQRVRHASVTIDGDVVGAVGRGHVLLVGLAEGDDEDDVGWMVDKVLGLRVFPDEEGKMDLSLMDVGGDLLVVSQFTLYGDVRKGRRPSFARAAEPGRAETLYQRFVQMLRERAPGKVETGEFGAMMDVELLNDGPVTILLER